MLEILRNKIFRIFLITLIALIFTLLSIAGMVPSNNKENDVTAPVILTFKELGYESSITKNSSISSFRINKEDAGMLYDLMISVDDVSNIWINIFIYQCNDINIAKTKMSELIVETIDYERRLDCHFDKMCFYPKGIYEEVIEYFVELDLTEWNVDEGYARDAFDDNTGKLFLRKENKLIQINYYNVQLNENILDEFKTLFEKSEEIFE